MHNISILTHLVIFDCMHVIQPYYSQVCEMVTSYVSHCSLTHNGLTATGAIALATALQDNKSLEELK